MDSRYLPDIFALTVFLGGFRPLVRRVGAHVNVWFAGWGLLLAHYAVLSLALPAAQAQTAQWLLSIETLAAIWTIELCALCFVVAAANMAGRDVSAALSLELALPVLLQSGFMVLAPGRGDLQVGAVTLFLLPALHVLVWRTRRTRSMFVLSAAFAVFAAISLATLLLAQPAPAHAPLLQGGSALAVAHGALAMLFLTAAYLYATASRRFSRGIVAAVTGLAAWGLSYPIADAYLRAHPGVEISRALLECPQYLVVAGIILTLLEEHIRRTERMAMHDPLTDLPNRRLFEERLIETMEDARRSRTTIACLVIDVDNFKSINDTLGHTAGDKLLRALAVRLSWHMSPRDILARTGGDEFTALLAGVSDENHLRFIASAMMSAASVPIAIDDERSVDVRISVGIALSPDHADDVDELRRMADEAMYSAKRRGGSLLAFAQEK